MSAQKDTDSDLVAQLLRAAGRREEPPADAYRQTLEAATLTWHRKVHGRMRRRHIAWAAAASVAVAVTAGLIVDSKWWAFDRQAVARLERVIGAAQMRDARDAHWVTVDDGSPALIEGASFRTDARGGAGVLLSGGASLRLSERTEILLASPTHIRLITGRVYLDNARSSDGSGIEIETPAGIARDVGTQFEVRYVDASYRLRVRDGRVHVRRGAIAIESSAGDEVSIDAAGTVTRERIARDDGEWRWVETLAPAPDLEGQPVSVLLAWVARETGRIVRFEPPEIEQKARTTILHGDVRTLAPLEALAVMLETTDLAYTMLEDGTIVIRSRGAG